jgi:hypothetical protein
MARDAIEIVVGVWVSAHEAVAPLVDFDETCAVCALRCLVDTDDAPMDALCVAHAVNSTDPNMNTHVSAYDVTSAIAPLGCVTAILTRNIRTVRYSAPRRVVADGTLGILLRRRIAACGDPALAAHLDDRDFSALALDFMIGRAGSVITVADAHARLMEELDGIQHAIRVLEAWRDAM